MLINCPECNKEISDVCINCGYPIKNCLDPCGLCFNPCDRTPENIIIYENGDVSGGKDVFIGFICCLIFFDMLFCLLHLFSYLYLV